MKASELRIGCWVKGKGNTRRITTIKPPHLYDVSQFEGVPLTEEWLKKFGFSPSNKERTIWRRLGISITFYPDYITLNVKGYRLINIKHVHELQNAFFALTGEELKFKRA